MIETIQHTLGLCSDSHPTLLTAFVEWPNLNNIFNYLKTWRKL